MIMVEVTMMVKIKWSDDNGGGYSNDVMMVVIMEKKIMV